MTRDEAKKILGENATEEQTTLLLNAFHNAEKAKNDEIANLKASNSKYSDYEDIKAKLAKFEQDSMTEQEKLEAMKKQTAENLKKASIIYNTAKAKEILAGETIDEELLLSLVSDNEEDTVKKANLFKQTLSSLKENISKKTKEELTTLNLQPGLSNVQQKDNGEMTMDKFMKLSAEEQEKFISEHPSEFEKL